MRIRPNMVQEAPILAPVGGLNTVDPGLGLPPLDCPLLFNMVGAENGLAVRRGFKEWCTGLTGAADNTVRSILPFHGSSTNGSKDKLFACTSTKIYPVGVSAAAPAGVLTFGSSANEAGWGISRGIVNAANNHFLMYCDEENGYHVYTESTDTWAAVAAGVGATQISGVDPARFVFVCVWKNWVLFVEKDTSRMWFGNAVRSLYGTVTSFDFGSQFQHGGNLVGLWSWSADAGSGVDDYLVCISSSGDVVVYQGTDPNDATKFSIRGTGFVGGVPKGRRIATDYGTELLILSSIGVVPASKLFNTDWTDTSIYATQKIANVFSRAVETYGATRGWSMRIHPEDGILLVTVPVADGQPTGQYAMSLRTRGWSQYRDLPILSNEVWGRRLYFGTADGRVCINTGYLDNVNLAASSYSLVAFSGITAFRNAGNPKQKQVKTIAATYLYEGGLLGTVEEARYRYDLTEATAPTPTPSNNTNAWDAGLWDTATWGGAFATQRTVRGAVGMGADVAIAFAGRASSRTVLVGIDVTYEEGGVL